MYDKIIVLDFGSQYNQLIARRIRDMGVYSELRSYDMPIDEIKNTEGIKGIVLSGGPNSVYDKNSFFVDERIYDLGIPVLGICYGMQLMSFNNGGKVIGSETKEYGRTEINVDRESKLFKGLPEKQIVWMSHGDKVSEIPTGFKTVAYSDNCENAAIENDERNLYALQFHPEVRNSEYGIEILKNFVFGICKANANWSINSYIDEQVNEIREIVKDKKVLLGLSGGVDSSVAACLINKAIGHQLTCMFIDHGLLRKDEAEQVVEVFQNTFKMNLVAINAKDRFLSKLKGVSDPETKRKIIGNEFVYTFDEESAKLGKFEFLAQGTLYTDVIESGTKTAQTIKSHHNVGGLPEDMTFQLLEPLNKLFKDEVRALGRELGLPDYVVERQPFPGPGLAIRVLGEVTEEKLKIVRDTDAILREEIKKAGLEKSIWQYFTVLPNIKSVGVMGDQRTYLHTIGIRAITSIDGMTGDYAKIPYDVLDNVSRRIINEVKEVNRVVYDITSKPPATIEWE